MFNVAYKITIGSTTLQSGKTSRLLELESSAALAVPVNRCRIVLDGQTRLSAAANDPVKVELGYNNNLPTIFTGKLDTINSRFAQICLEARGAFAELVAAHQNGVHEQQNAGAIVGDLLGARQIAQGTLAAGETFARFTFSDCQTVWAVIHDLGRRCGYDFYADCEDKAVFKHYAPKKTYLFTYRGDILDYRQIGQGPTLDEVEVYAESPATRTQSLVQNIAKNIVKADQAQTCGWLRALGAPMVQLGDAVQIAQMPDSAQNGTFKVTGVRHQLSREVGFITDIFWEKV
jgi:hypothetical protein